MPSSSDCRQQNPMIVCLSMELAQQHPKQWRVVFSYSPHAEHVGSERTESLKVGTFLEKQCGVATECNQNHYDQCQCQHLRETLSPLNQNCDNYADTLTRICHSIVIGFGRGKLFFKINNVSISIGVQEYSVTTTMFFHACKYGLHNSDLECNKAYTHYRATMIQKQWLHYPKSRPTEGLQQAYC